VYDQTQGFGAVFSFTLWITLLIMILKKRNKIKKIVYNFGYHFNFKIIIKYLVCENCQMISNYSQIYENQFKYLKEKKLIPCLDV
jgi:hypothetical protein